MEGGVFLTPLVTEKTFSNIKFTHSIKVRNLFGEIKGERESESWYRFAFYKMSGEEWSSGAFAMQLWLLPRNALFCTINFSTSAARGLTIRIELIDFGMKELENLTLVSVHCIICCKLLSNICIHASGQKGKKPSCSGCCHNGHKNRRGLATQRTLI